MKTIENIRELFEKETSLISRIDNPEYMDWLENKLLSKIKKIDEAHKKSGNSKLRFGENE